MKIPGLGRLAKWYSRKIGTHNFSGFKKNIDKLIKGIPADAVSLPVDIVSFSGSKTLIEQCYSTLSFYYNVGRPQSWTIYSDKSHSQLEIDFLQQIPGVQVKAWDSSLEVRIEALFEFGKFSIWGNRLHAYLNHPIQRTTIFTDSDMLFFPSFRNFLPVIGSGSWFMPDSYPHLDAYYFKQFGESQGPFVNAGFLIFNKRPSWEVAVDYIINRPDRTSWEHFTEQAAIHHMFKTDGHYHLLDENSFILKGSDSFKFGTDYKSEDIAVRHYVSTVRHKMWQMDWRKTLTGL
ncbi:hypothetical protein [Paraflavitalea pollutisoli]|uniref:hypothetical protein n=1 Tax=Paraflavitalea pollutisoli TaxID=3034143 RepID=UPI0023EB83A2|nr:hypothetical protein [Paraflavitalea sp. H1-2-19X]